MRANRAVTPEQSLAELAVRHAGASRVFHRHGLDFCCHGQVSLADACVRKGLEVGTLIDELERETADPAEGDAWDVQPIPVLVDYILDRFHAGHRAELPRLIDMARRVEAVHADKASCPHGLADHLTEMRDALELHMQKEEQILFPLLVAGRGRMAAAPIQVMEQEHDDHAGNLALLRDLTAEYTAPAQACGTWRALYLGLAELQREIMEHIHLENNVLFPRALRA